MRQNDMESIVSGIKQLSGVVVIVMPDCLLYSAWQRPGQSWDVEIVGAYLGQLMAGNVQGLQATENWTEIAQITIELKEGLIVLRPVQETFVVAYIFDTDTAMGWARLQIQRTLPLIRQRLEAESMGAAEQQGFTTIEPEPVSEPAPQPVAAPPKAAAAPAKPVMPPPATALPALGKPTTPQPAPAAAPAAPVGTPASAAPRRTPLKPTPPPAIARPKPVAAKPAPVPTAKPVSVGPASVNEVQSARSPAGTDDSDKDKDVPKGTRLIKYLDAHAPDTHAALLRVSLQTGLPLTLLRMPDSLSDDEFAQVEESVRRILGVDQLNF